MKKGLIEVHLVVFLIVFSIFCTEAICSEDAGINLDFGGWFATVSANAASGKGVASIDVMEDLGIDERKTIFPVSVSVNLGGPYNIFLNFYSFSISGDKVISDAITFNSQTFTADTLTKGTYKNNMLRGGVKYRLTSKERTRIHFNSGLFYQKLQLDLSNSLTSSSDSLTIPFPFIGFDVENRINDVFSWGGSIEGMALSFQDYSASYFDFSLFTKYYITSNFSIKGAYKYENIDSEKDESDFSNSSGGVYLGANLEW